MERIEDVRQLVSKPNSWRLPIERNQQDTKPWLENELGCSITGQSGEYYDVKPPLGWSSKGIANPDEIANVVQILDAKGHRVALLVRQRWSGHVEIEPSRKYLPSDEQGKTAWARNPVGIICSLFLIGLLIFVIIYNAVGTETNQITEAKILPQFRALAQTADVYITSMNNTSVANNGNPYFASVQMEINGLPASGYYTSGQHSKIVCHITYRATRSP